MLTILKRQADRIWWIDRSGKRGVWGDAVSDGAIAETMQGLLLDRLAAGDFGEHADVEVEGRRAVIATFEEGVVGVVLSRTGNPLTCRAALRRWPGAKLEAEAASRVDETSEKELEEDADEEKSDGFSEEATSRIPVDKDALQRTRNGLEEQTVSGVLVEDSFAEETVYGPRSYNPEELEAATRVMACTWIQVVEHIDRVAELIGDRWQESAPLETLSRVSSALGSHLTVKGDAISTSSAGERVGSADAEAVDTVYRTWVRRMGESMDVDLWSSLPALEARPWRGLLSDRDAPVEPISFSV